MTCCDRRQTIHPIAPGLTKSRAVFAIILVMGMTMAAAADAQNLDCCTASTAAPAGVTPVLYNLPNGSGAPFTQAGSAAGLVDATITLISALTIVCPWSTSRPPTCGWRSRSRPARAISWPVRWARPPTPTPTPMGVTTWTAPLRAGGWSTSGTMVVVNGAAVPTAPLILRHNSADLNGDEVANLADIPLFASDYFGPYAFRSDLWFDSVVNLSDIPRLAEGIGASCR
jgi:hypothetical protein